MIRIRRNEKESPERLIQRFHGYVQKGRLVILSKERMFWKKKLNRRQVRARAIMREFHRTEREKNQYL
ncbi:hypothetical protein HZA41_02500 [Candidatus Peregrinibacteria bacterium]|nr:hypothetical protein [Candidatus Peregrinibacteria bacterium]